MVNSTKMWPQKSLEGDLLTSFSFARFKGLTITAACYSSFQGGYDYQIKHIHVGFVWSGAGIARQPIGYLCKVLLILELNTQV